MNKNVEAAEPVVYKEITLNVAYQTEHNKVKKIVYPCKVRDDVVLVKRSPDAADSATISRARFDRFYTRVV
jgi:hypothetical protein